MLGLAVQGFLSSLCEPRIEFELKFVVKSRGIWNNNNTVPYNISKYRIRI